MSDTRLVPCSSCRRHIAAGEACPFCGAAAQPPTGGYGYPTAGKPGEEPNAMATLYGLPPATSDRVPAPHYGMPPPMTPGDRERLEEMGRLTAPRYGMPPLSPAHPFGLMRMLVILAIVAVAFLLYVRFIKA